MCGIAGIFGPGAESSRKELERMLTAIAHRGPDDRGIRMFPEAAIGHVRLSIIDITGGAQPMALNNRWHISYNGEVYNFPELKLNEEKNGTIFRGNSDTEVVLHLLANCGIEGLKRLRGMFALALWDNERQEALLARDRMGIKPLYYCNYKGRLYFASEIKALLAALPYRPELDKNSLHLLLNFRYIPGESTMFAGIKHLAPGHCLKWTADGIKILSWSPQKTVTGPKSPEELALTLRQAVKRQLVSDVPLGGYLSAGIDSATILALSETSYPTFTINTGDSPAEAAGAARTAAIFHSPNLQQDVNPEMNAILYRLIWHLEVPKVNGLQTALVARLAKSKVKVALSGLGGDEIFLGYNIHAWMSMIHGLPPGLSAVAKFLGKKATAVCPAPLVNGEEIRRSLFLAANLGNWSRCYGILRNVWDSTAIRNAVYGQEMLKAETDNAFRLLEDMWPRDEPDPVMATANFELKQKMVNDLLLQEDRLSMAFGLESRVPFLDEDLVDCAMAMGRNRLMRNGEKKGLLKHLAHQWLPEEIIKRPKSGFQIPIHKFYPEKLSGICKKILTRRRLQEDGLFNPDFVEKIINARPHKLLRWHYFLLYLILGTTIWIDIFQNGKNIGDWE